LILERLEIAQGHKEIVPGTTLTIEHVMPQTLTDDWKAVLGEGWEEDHEQYLHTLGNLTLTNYNAELGNATFHDKKKLFAESHVELNRYFNGIESWTAAEIDRRSEALIDMALSIWPYFGPEQTAVPLRADDATRVTGTVPTEVRVRTEKVSVQSWAEVAVAIVECIARVGEDEFDRVTEELPKFVNRDATAFRRSSRLKKLTNGAYLETNLSAQAVYRFCVQAAQLAGIGYDEWEVTYAAGTVEERTADTPSQVKQFQQEFWVAVRAALVAAEQFSSVASPKPQSWFDLPLGRTGIWMSLSANTQDRHVGVCVAIDTAKHSRALALLEAQREAIERELGIQLAWNPYPDKQTQVIKATWSTNLMDRDDWTGAIDWLTRTAVAFHKAFAPRVAQLNIRQQV
jgi:hypothetical protein